LARYLVITWERRPEADLDAGADRVLDRLRAHDRGMSPHWYDAAKFHEKTRSGSLGGTTLPGLSREGMRDEQLS
jgi:hypothetical protein